MNELETYCEDLYGAHRGYVYAPLRDPKKEAEDDGYWTQYYFKWPEQKHLLYQHINSSSNTHDVYIAPALFKAKKVSSDTIAGSQFVWADFDGELPSVLDTVPEPSFKIQSSETGHEHWYWRLDTFISDPVVFAGISKKLAYALNADRSGWDPVQVLRPPTTLHHDSGKTTFRRDVTDLTHSLESFVPIEDPKPKEIDVVQPKDLPDVGWVVALHKWESDTYELFEKPEIPKGQRSDALTRLAFDCAEMGLSDKEILAILYNADLRWKKFAKRNDQFKRLVSIVQYVRSKKVVKQELKIDSKATFYTLTDFMKLKEEMKWIVEGIIPEAGCTVLAGPPGCGKTALLMQLGLSVAQNQESYLSWDIVKGHKVGFFSAEMSRAEMAQYFIDMGHEDANLDNFFVHAQNSAFPLNNKKNKDTLLRYIETSDVKLLVLDSLGTVLGSSPNDDVAVNKFNEWVNKKIREEMNVAVAFIHHARKSGSDDVPYKMDDLSKVYGSQYISSNATTVIGMNRIKGVKKVDIFYLKGRFTQKEHDKLLVTDDRNFKEDDVNPMANGRKRTNNLSSEREKLSPFSG